jgi:phosphatidylinositol glycan class M
LYHIHRLDHRHNFSPYFYQFYLSSAPNFASAFSSSALSFVSSLARHPLAAFLPQIGLSTAAGFLLGARDLSLAWFVQTVVFVMFNKVCTSQASSQRSVQHVI